MANQLRKLKGLFFWRKKNEVSQAEEMIQLYLKYIPALRKMNAEDERTDGDIIGQMYDYYQDSEEVTTRGTVAWGDTGESPANKDERIEATPMSVMKELETVPTPFNTTDEHLDETIALFQDKSKLLHQRYAKDQIKGFVKRLENRKKYKQQVKFYTSFPNTMDEKIDTLLAKYKLEINKSDLFVPTFPKEAVEVMKQYTSVTKLICNEKPVFYVIAEHKDFVKKRKRLDPILLAQSPFGFYWQILGAWDKEMLLLSEL